MGKAGYTGIGGCSGEWIWDSCWVWACWSLERMWWKKWTADYCVFRCCGEENPPMLLQACGIDLFILPSFVDHVRVIVGLWLIVATYYTHNKYINKSQLVECSVVTWEQTGGGTLGYHGQHWQYTRSVSHVSPHSLLGYLTVFMCWGKSLVTHKTRLLYNKRACVRDI